MRTLIRTISVFVVLNLGTGRFAGTQSTALEETAPIAEQAVEGSAAETQGESVAEAIGAADIAKGTYDYVYIPYNSSLTKKQPHEAKTVLVIPSTEMTAGDLTAIMEDLSVMSRIFDKKLGRKEVVLDQFSRASEYFTYALSPGRKHVTEAIFLKDFGAIFLTSVDFPLSPPREMQEKKVDEGVDEVWADTKREIYSPEETVRKAEKAGIVFKKYDAEKVEHLKTTLLKALKHATNIRNLKQDEQVIVTIRGCAPSVFPGETATQRSYDGRFCGYEGATDERGLLIVSGDAVSAASTAVTIRAKKSDVDAFSKGKLDLDQFRKKVVTFAH